MHDHLNRLPEFVETVRGMMDIIITNVVLLGQVPAPTFEEQSRVELFLERLAEFQADESTTDAFLNPIGIIRGTVRDRLPIFIVAHMDSPFGKEIDHHYAVKPGAVVGAGVLDNALGAGVLLSLPLILSRLGLTFESDIVLVGATQSLGKGNLRGIRYLLKTWPTPIRGAVCIESGELGRLNYYSDGMIRGEITCQVNGHPEHHQETLPNAIVVINEIITQIMELRLPSKPRTKIVLGTIQGGLKHGQNAQEAVLGFEIRSDADEMVKDLYDNIKDIVVGVRHEYEVGLSLETISNLRAARLKYTHPLVKSTVAIMNKLGIEPISAPSESELAIFLARNIPAVTLAVTHGENYQQPDAVMQIEPMFKGIAQIVGTLMAIDRGVCDQ